MAAVTQTPALPKGAYPAKCRSCGAAIFWALTPRGRDCPFDAQPADDGQYVAGQCMGKLQMLKAPPVTAEPRYASHFVSCVNASSHSHKGKA